MEHERIAAHARRFTWRAEHIYGVTASANASPLYAHLSAEIADDPEIIRLVVGADSHTTVANLLFGAVHFLLLGGEQHPLAEYYATLASQPKPAQGAYPHFRDFCLAHAATIEALVTTRTVQTNEVQRCTGLLPAFTYLANRVNGAPLALIEVGASLGLNLLWDRYGYQYEPGGRIGEDAAFQLSCAVLGENRLPLPADLPKIASRVGIELMPVDLHDDDAIRWVQALIWPEHTDRHRRFQQALTIAQTNPPPIVAGDMVVQLPNVLANMPMESSLCVYHSYTLNQCPREVGVAVHDLLIVRSETRPPYRLALEWYNGQEHPHLDLFSYCDGQVTQELLAYCESHGRWIEWLV